MITKCDCSKNGESNRWKSVIKKIHSKNARFSMEKSLSKYDKLMNSLNSAKITGVIDLLCSSHSLSQWGESFQYGAVSSMHELNGTRLCYWARNTTTTITDQYTLKHSSGWFASPTPFTCVYECERALFGVCSASDANECERAGCLPIKLPQLCEKKRNGWRMIFCPKTGF